MFLGIIVVHWRVPWCLAPFLYHRRMATGTFLVIFNSETYQECRLCALQSAIRASWGTPTVYTAGRSVVFSCVAKIAWGIQRTRDGAWFNTKARRTRCRRVMFRFKMPNLWFILRNKDCKPEQKSSYPSYFLQNVLFGMFFLLSMSTFLSLALTATNKNKQVWNIIQERAMGSFWGLTLDPQKRIYSIDLCWHDLNITPFSRYFGSKYKDHNLHS